MALIKVGPAVFVAADQIASIYALDAYEKVVISCKDGERYALEPEYGESKTAAMDRIVREVNDALSRIGKG